MSDLIERWKAVECETGNPTCKISYELAADTLTALREQEVLLNDLSQMMTNEGLKTRTELKARIEELEAALNKYSEDEVLLTQQARIDELETKVQLQLNYIKRLQIESIEDKTDE